MPYPRPRHWRLHSPHGQRKYLNADERRRFLAAADEAAPELRTFCHMLAWTGCRLSEARGLHSGDIDAAGSVTIRSLKKREHPTVREVPVPDHLVALLRAMPSTNGRCWPWARTTAYRHVKDVMAAAGIAGLHASPKGLRHGFGVQAVRAGVPLNLLQRWLGHADIATTAIYADAMGAEEREIAARMW